MQVRCPHCSTVFGTERGGTQYCPHCGAQLHVPEAAEAAPGGLPTPGTGGGGAPLPPEEVAIRGPTPWERRGELGLLRALLLTMKESALSPQEFWPRVRPEAPWTEALLYGWAVAVVAALVSVPFLYLAGLSAPEQYREAAEQMKDMSPQMREWMERVLSVAEQSQPTSLLGILGRVLGSALLWPLYSVITAALLHLSCMAFGCAQGGFNATYRALGYATAPSVLGSVTCVGPLAGLYVLVLVGWGLKELHRTSGERAALAVVTPFALLCCCGGCLSMAGVAALVQTLGAGG